MNYSKYKINDNIKLYKKMISQFRNLIDCQGNVHVLFEEAFLDEDREMGDNFSDYEIIKYLGENYNSNFVAKVRSLNNNKIYIMRHIDLTYFNNKEKEKEKKEFLRGINRLKNLNNPNIIKYYKSFIEDNNNLYIITEYMNNSDLYSFIKTKGFINEEIKEVQMWNFLIQCLSAIDYFHQKNLDFVGIKLNNVYMNNEENLKIDIISWPPKSSDRNYDKKDDIYFLGRIFYAVSFYKNDRIKNSNSISNFPIMKENNFDYPDLMNIINLMLDYDSRKRPNSSTLLKRVENEFIRKYKEKKEKKENKKEKNEKDPEIYYNEIITIIECVLRCLYAYPDLNKYYINNENNKEKFEKDEDKYYINNLVMIALNAISGTGESNFLEACNKIKRSIICENSKLDSNYDIIPVYVTAFLLGKMHLEENEVKKEKQYVFDSILNGEEEDKTNKLQMRNNFISYYNNNFNSLISKSFFGFEEIKRTCEKCNINTFSFNDFCFIKFDISKEDPNEVLELFDLFKNNLFNEQNENKEFICEKCLEESNNFNYLKESKSYYFSKYLIIYFNRGKDYNQSTISGYDNLDFSEYVINNSDSSKKFELIGCILMDKDNNSNKINFIYYYKDLKNKNEWIYPGKDNPMKAEKNVIIMLFYKEINDQSN